MTDAEFINESLQLKEKIVGLKVTMERLRKFFEYALRELCNKNYAEAEKLFRKYWHQHNQDFRVFHNLSENEIYNIIKRRMSRKKPGIPRHDSFCAIVELIRQVRPI